MSATSDRFTVGDEVSGMLESFTHFQQALACAMRLRSDHPTVAIYDRMARRGGKQLWEWNGNSFACTKTRGNDGLLPMCYGCGEKRAKRLLTLPKSHHDPCYCSLECAALDAVEHVISQQDWCEPHQEWFNPNEGCSRCVESEESIDQEGEQWGEFAESERVE